jgi:exodeoxyribonuclease-5
VHKAQGSEWSHVLLLDECCDLKLRREWPYTATTRAAIAITVVDPAGTFAALKKIWR